MIVNVWIGNVETQGNDVEEPGLRCGRGSTGEVIADMKREFIDACFECGAREQGLVDTAVRVGHALRQADHRATVHTRHHDANAGSRFSRDKIKNMRGQSAHRQRFIQTVERFWSNRARR